MSELDQFKLDGVILRDESDKTYVIINFNLPVRLLEEQQSVQNSLQKVKDVLYQEFPSNIALNNVFYSISATYTLQHRSTGEERDWLGSFQPRNQQNHFVAPFCSFSGHEFVTNVQQKIQLDGVRNKMRWSGMESVWAFSTLKSIIITVHTSFPKNVTPFVNENAIITPTALVSARTRRHTQFTHYLV